MWHVAATCSASRLQAEIQLLSPVPAWQNDFQMAGKFILKRKNVWVQLKKQDMTKVQTFSRTEMSSREVRWRTVCSTALFLSQKYKNVCRNNFLDEFYWRNLTNLFALLFNFYRRDSTRRAQYAGKITVSICNSKLAKLVRMLNIFTIYFFVFLFFKRTLVFSWALFWTVW